MHHRCTTDSRFERDVNTKSRQELGFDHADHVVRGRLLAEIAEESTKRTLFDVELPDLLGIPVGSLGNGTLSTARLREALAKLQALPNDQMNLTGLHSGPVTVLP